MAGYPSCPHILGLFAQSLASDKVPTSTLLRGTACYTQLMPSNKAIRDGAKHLFSPENTIISPGGAKSTACLTFCRQNLSYITAGEALLKAHGVVSYDKPCRIQACTAIHE